VPFLDDFEPISPIYSPQSNIPALGPLGESAVGLALPYLFRGSTPPIYYGKGNLYDSLVDRRNQDYYESVARQVSIRDSERIAEAIGKMAALSGRDVTEAEFERTKNAVNQVLSTVGPFLGTSPFGQNLLDTLTGGRSEINIAANLARAGRSSYDILTGQLGMSDYRLNELTRSISEEFLGDDAVFTSADIGVLSGALLRSGRISSPLQDIVSGRPVAGLSPAELLDVQRQFASDQAASARLRLDLTDKSRTMLDLIEANSRSEAERIATELEQRSGRAPTTEEITAETKARITDYLATTDSRDLLADLSEVTNLIRRDIGFSPGNSLQAEALAGVIKARNEDNLENYLDSLRDRENDPAAQYILDMLGDGSDTEEVIAARIAGQIAELTGQTRESLIRAAASLPEVRNILSEGGVDIPLDDPFSLEEIRKLEEASQRLVSGDDDRIRRILEDSSTRFKEGLGDYVELLETLSRTINDPDLKNDVRELSAVASALGLDQLKIGAGATQQAATAYGRVASYLGFDQQAIIQEAGFARQLARSANLSDPDAMVMPIMLAMANSRAANNLLGQQANLRIGDATSEQLAMQAGIDMANYMDSIAVNNLGTLLSISDLYSLEDNESGERLAGLINRIREGTTTLEDADLLNDQARLRRLAAAGFANLTEDKFLQLSSDTLDNQRAFMGTPTATRAARQQIVADKFNNLTRNLDAIIGSRVDNEDSRKILADLLTPDNMLKFGSDIQSYVDFLNESGTNLPEDFETNLREVLRGIESYSNVNLADLSRNAASLDIDPYINRVASIRELFDLPKREPIDKFITSLRDIDTSKDSFTSLILGAVGILDNAGRDNQAVKLLQQQAEELNKIIPAEVIAEIVGQTGDSLPDALLNLIEQGGNVPTSIGSGSVTIDQLKDYREKYLDTTMTVDTMLSLLNSFSQAERLSEINSMNVERVTSLHLITPALT